MHRIDRKSPVLGGRRRSFGKPSDAGTCICPRAGRAGPGRWVDARDLRVGDVVLRRSGAVAKIEGIASRLESRTVFNFEVAELHSYAVGRVAILVHNRLDPLPPGTKIPDETPVLRGGQCTPEQLEANGARTLRVTGKDGVSVESHPAASIEELAGNLPGDYGQVGVTTAKEIRSYGGEVTATPGRSPSHATVSGIDAPTLSNLFRPTIPNPARMPRPTNPGPVGP